jgi:hypothetical protein
MTYRKPTTERSPADRLLRAHVNYDAIERLTHQVTYATLMNMLIYLTAGIESNR